ELLKTFLLYRTYHGSAMSPVVQSASIAAWNDETHVLENRALYRTKFAQVTPMLAEVIDVALPDAGFYLWANVARTGLDDATFTRELLAEQNVAMLPGSYVARDVEVNGTSGRTTVNPGRNYVRIALVANVEECLEGARRIVEFCRRRK
ncbi:MAG TPA: aminotransferase class I/II-fold pyridoxal phosphate-dependent enzyme, partial [Burkholderiaceae bacterium]|nr:aminotransferase class I/II-fold pyridoxal phosphate-dependent enzyme [Burkholderiaceae bacterium]